MNRPLSPEQLMPVKLNFELDGREVEAFEGESIFDAAKRHGTELPHLCHSDPLRPDGNCRACVVEVAGERALAASCCRSVTPGLKVLTDSLRAKKSRQMVSLQKRNLLLRQLICFPMSLVLFLRSLELRLQKIPVKILDSCY